MADRKAVEDRVSRGVLNLWYPVLPSWAVAGAPIGRCGLPALAPAWEAYTDAAAAHDDAMTEDIRQLEQTRDTWDSPEASGDAIAQEFERYLRRGGEGPGKPGREDPRRN